LKNYVISFGIERDGGIALYAGIIKTFLFNYTGCYYLIQEK